MHHIAEDYMRFIHKGISLGKVLYKVINGPENQLTPEVDELYEKVKKEFLQNQKDAQNFWHEEVTPSPEFSTILVDCQQACNAIRSDVDRYYNGLY